jgi:hypothetical protein
MQAVRINFGRYHPEMASLLYQHHKCAAAALSGSA